MDKNIGFRRNIYRTWLDAAGAICVEERDAARVRSRLDPIVAQQITGTESRRMALDVLLGIWVKTGDRYPDLHKAALALYADTETPEARLWLHYGLALLAYDFFQLCAGTVGRLSQYDESFATKDIKQRIFAEMGQLGGLERSTERVLSSLRDWGVVIPGPKRYSYKPLRQGLTAPNKAIEEWLLASALTASPAEEIPFGDLVQLPELFPFRVTLSVSDLRHSAWFEVQRQGIGWDMVRRKPVRKARERQPKTDVATVPKRTRAGSSRPRRKNQAAPVQ